MWHCRIKNKGFVLISILILLSVLSMIGLFAMMQSVISQKSARMEWQDEILLQTARDMLSEIEKNIVRVLPDCLISPISQYELVNQPLSWWQASSCAGIFHLFQYYYVFESMGEDVCATVGSLSANNENRADYFRITLRMSSGNDSTIFLQSTLVRPKITSLLCHEQYHEVFIGRQNLRELI